MNLQGEGIYKRHRIHVCQLNSGAFAAAVVQFGASGSGVEHVGGKYESREAAVSAAKAYIDSDQALQN